MPAGKCGEQLNLPLLPLHPTLYSVSRNTNTGIYLTFPWKVIVNSRVSSWNFLPCGVFINLFLEVCRKETGFEKEDYVHWKCSDSLQHVLWISQRSWRLVWCEWRTRKENNVLREKEKEKAEVYMLWAFCDYSFEVAISERGPHHPSKVLDVFVCTCCSKLLLVWLVYLEVLDEWRYISC